DFAIVGSCTFDSGAPVRAYGDMGLGNGTTAGSVSWQAGNAIVLDILGLAGATTGSTIDMTNGGTLRSRGAFDASNVSLTGGTGTVEFAGTGQSITASNTSTFHNVSITGTATLSGELLFNGTLNAGAGATLTGAASSVLKPRNGSSISGS